MTIGNTYLNSHYGQLAATHSAAPVALFMRAGDNYDLAYSAPSHKHTQALAAGGPLERVLCGHAGPVPVKRVHGSAYILGQRLNAGESRTLAAVGADLLVGLGAPGHLDGLLCLSTAAADAPFFPAPDFRMFPSERPHVRGLDYHSDWRAADGPSGDYLDCFELPEGQMGLAIGDVAGQNFSTTLLTSSLHGIARALRSSHHGCLSQLMRTIDEVFCEVCPGNSYATLFFARYDPHRGMLHYVNAGHESPVLMRKTGNGYRPVLLDPSGPVIGMLRKSAFRENAISLAPGDLLALYTDGLCGATSAKGEEWGFRRFLETVQANSRQRARDIVDRVFESVESFAAGSPQYDDMTLWLGRVRESGNLPVLLMSEPERLAAVA